jgi:transmembrane sensor
MDSLEGLEALGRRVAEGNANGPTEAERLFLRERFLLAVRAARRRRTVRRVSAGLALAAAAAVAGFVMLRRTAAADIGFSVDGAPGKVGEFLPSPADRAIKLTFNEGTSAVLAPKTRSRVASVSPNGADMIIESGKARLAVVPRAHNRWTVRAGPFVVHVTGTRFDVAWDPVKDRFVLELYEGSLTLSGCVFGEGNALVAGERVEAGCGLAEYRVSKLAARGKPREPPVDVAASASPAASSAEGLAERVRPDWLTLARAGRYGESYRTAEADGFDELCGKSNAGNLLLLGDVARLSGHTDQARAAYLMVRSRFARSQSAAIAAFYLGRLELDANPTGSAKKWLLTYLEEMPDGPLSAAALGRLLEVQIAAHDRDSAVALARQYLDRYPSGPHSAAAERVLSEESGHGRR